MSSLTITLNGQTQVVQLGTLSAAVNQQITQAVSASAASATSAATSAGEASASATDAASSASQAAQYVAELPSLVVQQAATFASLPANPVGLCLVLTDETKSGNPTIYFFTASHRYWIAMVQDA